MKKILKIAGGLLAAIFLITFIILYFCLNSATKSTVELVGSRMTKTTVKIGGASLSPFNGAGHLRAVVLGNPEGFKASQSIVASEVRVDLALNTVFSDPLVIEGIYINAPEVTYEVGLGATNIDRILKNIDEFIGEEKSTRKVIIQDFWLKGGKLTMCSSLMTSAAFSVPIPDVHLTDIGKKSNGETLKEALTEIMKPVTASVASASTDLTHVFKSAGGVIKAGTDSFKKLFGK